MKGNEFEDVVHRYYLEHGRRNRPHGGRAPADTSVIVVSDHGAKRMVGAVCINEFLIREGYLVLKSTTGRSRRV